MGKERPVAGLAWTGGAIGNAKWTGVRLIDVLKAANFNPDCYKNPDKLHIQVLNFTWAVTYVAHLFMEWPKKYDIILIYLV